MSLESLSSEDNAKLRNVIENGVQTSIKIKDLRESQRDLVKALATEFQIEVRDINNAIRVAVKESLDAEKESMDNVELILQLVGRS